MIDSELLGILVKKYRRVIVEEHQLILSTLDYNFRIDYDLLGKCFDESYNVKRDIVEPEVCCSSCFVDETDWGNNFIGLRVGCNGNILCKQCDNAMYYEFDYGL